MDQRFTERYLNEGFSGGEKKRNEILQMALMEPDFAVLDETDSGLDIDALRVVAHGINEVRKDRPELGILLITHYQRILDHLTPDVVHILLDGRIVESGGPELAQRVESDGFDAFRKRAPDGAPRRRRDQARLPDPRTRGARQAARVPRQRVELGEADRGARRDGRPLPDLVRQRAPRRLHDRRRERPRPTRPHAPRSRASSAPGETEEIVFIRNATEAINLVAYTWAPSQPPRR